MIKRLNELGDSWFEILANGILIILFIPLITLMAVVALPFLAPMYLWSWLRKEPHPLIPDVAGSISEGADTQEMVDLYLAKAKSLIEDIRIQSTKPEGAIKGYTLSSGRTAGLDIDLYYAFHTVGFAVKGIRSDYWHTGEEDSIDIFFWIVIALLRYGVIADRDILGLKHYWVCVDELGVWVKLAPDRSALVETSFSFYRKPPRRIIEDFSTLKSAS